ncbi:MAG: hypothetical protein WAL26_19720 [Mycobacterium sp.]
MRQRLSALWVRNIIGAVVATVAIGVIVATVLWDQWTTYRHTVVPETVVPVGRTGTAGGYIWKVDSVKHLNRNSASYGPELPAGTVLTVITVDRSGPPSEGICEGVITDGDRQWAAENIGGLGPSAPEGVSTICGDKPGPVQFSFLLPQDVVPSAVDVTTFDGQITARLLL